MNGSRKHGYRWLMSVGVLLLCGLSAPLFGQTVDSYELRHYANGAAAPVQTSTFPASAASCNQPDPGPASTVNPTRIVWDDPVNPGRVCIQTFAAGDVLFSLPVGNYEAALVAVNAAGASGESPRAPFSRLNVPPAPSGLKFGR